MSRMQRTRMLQKTAYLLSAIVALSMILSLIGPLLERSGQSRVPTPPPTATWPPTWTPVPALPLSTPILVEPALSPTASPTITPTLSITPTTAP